MKYTVTHLPLFDMVVTTFCCTQYLVGPGPRENQAASGSPREDVGNHWSRSVFWIQVKLANQLEKKIAVRHSYTVVLQNTDTDVLQIQIGFTIDSFIMGLEDESVGC